MCTCVCHWWEGRDSSVSIADKRKRIVSGSFGGGGGGLGGGDVLFYVLSDKFQIIIGTIHLELLLV